jgi:hypothetical protein
VRDAIVEAIQKFTNNRLNDRFFVVFPGERLD